MTTASTDHALAGAWRARLTFTEGPRQGEYEPVRLTFTEGPRQGEYEPVRLTFLPGGVIVHADEIPAESGQLPRGIGEWTSQDDHFSYWFNVVLNDPTGRPAIVVYVHGNGKLAADRQSLTASGGSEVYGSTGELLATNRADLHATRLEDRRPERGPTTSTSDPYYSTSDQNSPLDQVGTTILFENDRVRVWEMTLEPGETCDLHRHRHDYLMIYPDAALGRSSSRSRLERAEAGLVAFATVGAEGLPPHQITNAGGSPSTHYVVELLGPSGAATAQPIAHNGRVSVEHDPGPPGAPR
jgi:hypothetical protein